jgi:hypothetical protein
MQLPGAPWRVKAAGGVVLGATVTEKVQEAVPALTVKVCAPAVVGVPAAFRVMV